MAQIDYDDQVFFIRHTSHCVEYVNKLIVNAEDNYVLFFLFLPTAVQTCKHDADDYSSCMRLAIQEAWPNFVQGIAKKTGVFHYLTCHDIEKKNSQSY